MDTFKGSRQSTKTDVSADGGGGVNVRTERTYCFTAVCDQAGRLLEGLLQVVLEPLVLVLLGAELHELTWKQKPALSGEFTRREKSCRPSSDLAPGPR